MKFIELKKLDTRRNKRPAVAFSPPFLEWKVGYVVTRQGSVSRWQIAEIDTGDMSYQSTVILRSVADLGDEETRTLKGATLQTGYRYYSGEPAKVEDEWSPMTIAVESIRCFYPRKEGRPGCRVMTTDGVAYAVANGYDELREMV